MAQRGIRYLTAGDVVAIHHYVMEQLFGTSPAPLLHEGLLESAVMRAQTAAYYEQADLIRQSAVLIAGIAQAQAFLDGNKRTALAGEAFLITNGFEIEADPVEIGEQIVAIADRADSLEEATRRFENWLRGRVRPVTG